MEAHCLSSFVGQRARNIMVTVSLSEEKIMRNGDNICAYAGGIANQFDNLLTCSEPMIGRFVQLQMLNRAECLHFYEVKVHGL